MERATISATIRTASRRKMGRRPGAGTARELLWRKKASFECVRDHEARGITTVQFRLGQTGRYGISKRQEQPFQLGGGKRWASACWRRRAGGESRPGQLAAAALGAALPPQFSWCPAGCCCRVGATMSKCWNRGNLHSRCNAILPRWW